MQYLIWSNEHSAWWRADSCGYVIDARGAGRYTREEAMGICGLCRAGWDPARKPSEIPVLASDIDELNAPFLSAVALPLAAGSAT